jgi:F-type H+-transporting ATPase subunit alpha
MAAFAKFGSDLDVSTQRLLARGARLTELLKQPQYSPLAVEEQVVSIYAGTRGYLDGIEVSQVGRFESELLARIHANHAALLEGIRTTKALTPELVAELKDILAAFAKTFA